MSRTFTVLSSLRSRLSARVLGMFFVVAVPVACSDGNSSDSAQQTTPALDHLSLTVPTALANGRVASASAKAVYSDGSQVDVSGSVTWTSDAPLILSVSDDSGSKGALRALAPGIAHVQATLNGISASAELDVGAAVLDVLALAPSANAVAKGLSLVLSAQGTYSDGTQQDVSAQVSWSVSDGSIASLGSNAEGNPVLSGLQEGTVTLHGQLGDQGADVQISVSPAVLSSLAIAGGGTPIAAGSSAQLTINGTYSDGASAGVTENADWSTSDGSVATVSNGAGSKGLISAVASGTATITAVIGSLTVSQMVVVY